MTKKQANSGNTVTVEQIKSPQRRPAEQRATLQLGLRKIRARSTLPDTPQVRGMISAVKHLVRVVEG